MPHQLLWCLRRNAPGIIESSEPDAFASFSFYSFTPLHTRKWPHLRQSHSPPQTGRKEGPQGTLSSDSDLEKSRFLETLDCLLKSRQNDLKCHTDLLDLAIDSPRGLNVFHACFSSPAVALLSAEPLLWVHMTCQTQPYLAFIPR